MNERAEAEFELGRELFIKEVDCTDPHKSPCAGFTVAQLCTIAAKSFCDQFAFDDEQIPSGSGFSLTTSNVGARDKEGV